MLARILILSLQTQLLEVIADSTVKYCSKKWHVVGLVIEHTLRSKMMKYRTIFGKKVYYSKHEPFKNKIFWFMMLVSKMSILSLGTM